MASNEDNAVVHSNQDSELLSTPHGHASSVNTTESTSPTTKPAVVWWQGHWSPPMGDGYPPFVAFCSLFGFCQVWAEAHRLYPSCYLCSELLLGLHHESLSHAQPRVIVLPDSHLDGMDCHVEWRRRDGDGIPHGVPEELSSVHFHHGSKCVCGNGSFPTICTSRHALCNSICW